MKKIRALRSLLSEFRDNKTIDVPTYRKLYLKAKGGEYRSRAHLKTHIEQTKGKGSDHGDRSKIQGQVKTGQIGKNRLQSKKATDHFQKTEACSEKSLKNMNAQLVIPGKEGDATLVSANSVELKKYGYSSGTGNLPSAYLTGLLLGFRAKKMDMQRLYSTLESITPQKVDGFLPVLKGAVDSGLEVPHDPEIFPSEEGSLEKSLTNTERQTYQCS